MRVTFFRVGALMVALSAAVSSAFATNPTNTGYMGPQGSPNSTSTGTADAASPVTNNNWMPPPPPPSQSNTTGTDSTNPIDTQITNYPADATSPGGDDSNVGGMWGPNGQPGTSKGNMPPPPSQDNVWQDSGASSGSSNDTTGQGMNGPNGQSGISGQQDGPGMGRPGGPPPGGPGMSRPGGPGMNGPQGGQGSGSGTGSSTSGSSKAPTKKSAPSAQGTKSQKQAKSNIPSKQEQLTKE